MRTYRKPVCNVSLHSAARNSKASTNLRRAITYQMSLVVATQAFACQEHVLQMSGPCDMVAHYAIIVIENRHAKRF